MALPFLHLSIFAHRYPYLGNSKTIKLKRVIFLFLKIKIFRRFNYFFQNKNKKNIVSAFFVFYFCLRNQQFFLFLPGKNMGTACESRTVAQL